MLMQNAKGFFEVLLTAIRLKVSAGRMILSLLMDFADWYNNLRIIDMKSINMSLSYAL